MSNLYDDDEVTKVRKKRRKRPKYNPLRIAVFGGGGVAAGIAAFFLGSKLINGSRTASIPNTEAVSQIAELEPSETVSEMATETTETIDQAAMEELMVKVLSITDTYSAIDKEFTEGHYKEYKVTDDIKAYTDDAKVQVITVAQSEASPRAQKLYYENEALVYADLEDDINTYGLYVQNGELLRVAIKEKDGGTEAVNIDGAEAQGEAWYVQAVKDAANYLTTSRTAVATAIKEQEAAAQAAIDTAKAEASSSKKTSSSSSKKTSSSSSKKTSSSSSSSSSKNNSSSSSSSSSKKDTSSKTETSTEKKETTTAKEIFSDSSKKKLTTEQISKLSKSKLQTALNEIYARNGYKFSNKEKYEYFCQFSWYKPDTSDHTVVEGRFNEVEKYNYDLITQYQVEKGYRDASTLK